MKVLPFICVAIFVGSCATSVPPPDATDPANSAGMEGAPPAPSVLARAKNGPLFAPAADAPAARGHGPLHGGASPARVAPTVDEVAAGGAPSAPAAEEKGTSSAAPPARAPKAKPPPTAAPSANIYACPMHPEVTSSAPGNCPKCGMALKKRATP